MAVEQTLADRAVLLLTDNRLRCLTRRRRRLGEQKRLRLRLRVKRAKLNLV